MGLEKNFKKIRKSLIISDFMVELTAGGRKAAIWNRFYSKKKNIMAGMWR